MLTLAVNVTKHSLKALVSGTKEIRDALNCRLLQFDNADKSCYSECPKNVSLGNRNLDLSIKVAAGSEGLERNEMKGSEVKVLAEMLYAEQRLLVQLNSTCLHLQVM